MRSYSIVIALQSSRLGNQSAKPSGFDRDSYRLPAVRRTGRARARPLREIFVIDILARTIRVCPESCRPLDFHSVRSPVWWPKKLIHIQMALALAANSSGDRRNVRLLLWPVSNAARGRPDAGIYRTAHGDGLNRCQYWANT